MWLTVRAIAGALRRLYEMDCVLRWDVEQDGGAKDVFEALGGQLWGSRLSQLSAHSRGPFTVCDTVLVVVKMFGTSKVMGSRHSLYYSKVRIAV